MRLSLILIAAAISAPAMAAPTKISVNLTGAAEFPGPGSDKGAGTAELSFDSDKNQVCYTLTATGTDTPTMAHIHKAAVGAAGPVVVPLEAPASGTAQGCATVAPDLLKAIIATPADYYVNIHTAAFPKGALRSQLSK